jgi:hypothetical protein
MGAIRATAAAVLILIAAAASAADCVTGVRLLSTRASVPNLVAGPAAWSGSVLAVAKKEEANPNAIWIAVYNDAMETLIADRLIATDASRSMAIIALLWNGTEFGLFYTTDNDIHLQRLSMMGDPIGGPLKINPTRRPRLGDDIEVVWSSALDAWVVARHIGTGPSRGLWVTVVETNGAEQLDIQVPSSPPVNPHLALAVNDTGVIGLFHLTNDSDTLQFTTIKPGAFPHTLNVTSSGTDVQVAAAGDLFVVTRAKFAVPDAEIRWFVVDSDHQLVRPDGVLVDGLDRVPLPLGLLNAGSELALAYSYPPPGASATPVYRLLRFTLAGAIISDTPFAGDDLTASRALSSYPPVWTGMAYLNAAVRETTARLDSYLVRYCPLRAEIEAPSIVLVGQPVTLTTLVSGGDAPYKYAWTIARDPGGARTGPTVQRTFSITGSRLITVVVTDDSGATTTATFTLEVVDEIVEPPPPPVKNPRRRGVRK